MTSFAFDIEIMPWKPVVLTYAATTHWYACPGATSSVQPMPDEALQPVPKRPLQGR
jgi:hypothetical protein